MGHAIATTITTPNYRYLRCLLKTAWLNEKVGFKISTCFRKNSILCSELHSGTAKWTSGVGWNFGPLGIARGRKGNGTGLTFEPLGLLFRSDKRAKKNYIYTTRAFETHIHTLADLVAILFSFVSRTLNFACQWCLLQ